jgi:thiol-disulfide isomerase/thioredoxin
MRQIVTLLTVLLMAATSVEAQSEPRFSIPTVTGKTLSVKGVEQGVEIADYKGKIVFLEFWGTWCGPCLMSIPHYVALQEKYSDKLRVVAIETTPENTRAELQAYVKDPASHIDMTRIAYYLNHKAKTAEQKASLQKPIATLKAFIASKKPINYDVVAYEDGKNFVSYIAARARWQGYLPFMIVIDGKGEVREIVPGMPTEAYLEQLIRALLAEEKAK